jgi:hypothetical protein
MTPDPSCSAPTTRVPVHRRRSGRAGPKVCSRAVALALLSLLALPASASALEHPFIENLGAASGAEPTFTEPQGMAVDQATGDLLVIDREAGTLSRWHSDGTASEFSALGTNVIDELDFGNFTDPGEVEVAIDESGGPTDGDIYVPEAGGGVVAVFSEDGDPIGQVSESSEGPFKEPCGVAVDPSANIYVGDYSGKIHKYEPAANPPANSDNTDNLPFASNCTLAAGTGPTAGFIFPVHFNGAVAKLESTAPGAEIYEVDPRPTTTATINPTTGTVLAGVGNEVREFDASGPTEAIPGIPIAPGGERVTGITVDGSSGHIYVSRKGNPHIEVWGPAVQLPSAATEEASIDDGIVTLHGKVGANEGPPATCVFQYANVKTDGFKDATSVPCEPAGPFTGDSEEAVSALLPGLPEGWYRFRLLASNQDGSVAGDTLFFSTIAEPPLPDARAYELVSPPGRPRGGRFLRSRGVPLSRRSLQGALLRAAPATHSRHPRALRPWQPAAEDEVSEGVCTQARSLRQKEAQGQATQAPASAGDRWPLNCRKLGLTLCAGVGLLVPSVPTAAAASPPQVGATWVTDVTATSATLRAEIDPRGAPTGYRFQYIPSAAYQANLDAVPPREGFSGAASAPPSGSADAGEGSSVVLVSRHITKLAPATRYRYRALASSPQGDATGPERELGTQAATNAFSLPDQRGWELVSPIDKGGGAIQAPESIFGGGVFQAAADGLSFTYSSADSFGQAQGAPPGSQYLAHRNGVGWASENITAPLTAGGYGETPNGVPYQLFSADLSRALLDGGQRCRTQPGECPLVNPPPGGPEAPPGYRNYYLRDPDGSFQALLGAAGLAHTELGPSQFEVALAGATPDLAQVVLSSCAALAVDATELAAPEGCDPGAQNLYLWSTSGLELVNLLPGESQGTPGAAIAAPAGAISADGEGVFWTLAGDLYLREGGSTEQLDAEQGGGGEFQLASADASFAYFTKGSDLFRYDAESDLAESIASGVKGVLGGSADGSTVYFQDLTGLKRWRSGATQLVALGTEATVAADYPPATGTARISADGERLLFVSEAELSGYDNHDELSGQPLPEVYLYDASTSSLTCVSCNPTGERPEGPASVPGAIANGQAPGTTRAYRPRALAAGGRRAFFTSADDLAIQDTNSEPDVYQWEARGLGDCGSDGGCTSLLSSGRSPQPSYFLADSSLAHGDPGSYDVYDARIGGGFPPPPNVIPCIADACQPLPEAPDDPSPGTLVPSSGNPPPRFAKFKQRRRHRHRRHHRHHRDRHPGHGARR